VWSRGNAQRVKTEEVNKIINQVLAGQAPSLSLSEAEIDRRAKHTLELSDAEQERGNLKLRGSCYSQTLRRFPLNPDAPALRE
jgi:hypothetical protein